MTTSVFYPASSGALYQASDANGTAARSLAREITQAATIAERVFATGSGSTTMTSGTLTNTPTSGDVLIAVLYRRADGQATITNPTGWTRLTTGGTSGSRLLEVWWYRSTGVVGDKGSFAWTVTSATGTWGIELVRIGGSGAMADPVLKTGATSFTSTTTPAAVTENPVAGQAPGMALTCIAVTGTSLGASGITAAFSGTGTAESSTLYYDSTYGAGAVHISDIYNNASFPTYSYGSAYTLGAARAGHQAVIHLNGGGASTYSTGTSTEYGAGMNTSAGQGALFQSFLTYDTSAIPDNNTVSSATLQLRASATVLTAVTVGDPANSTLQARYYGTSITNTRAFDNNHWALSPSGMSGKTLLATYPAASAWTAGNDYALTSTASFLTSINKTGNTVIMMTTDDFSSATARTTSETYAYDMSGTLAPLTVVHSYQATVTIPATLNVSGAKTSTDLARTIAATLNVTSVRGIVGVARTIAATINANPAVTAVGAYRRTIAATVNATPAATAFRTIPRTIAATFNVSGNESHIIYRFVTQPARYVQLAQQATLRLAQTTRARIGQRSTAQLPKE